MVAIEQPELHCHPALQMGLADALVAGTCLYDDMWEEAQRIPRIFIVETHSEHMLLRFLRRVREPLVIHPRHLKTPEEEDTAGHSDILWQLDPSEDAGDLAVNILERHESGTIVRRLKVDADGEFTEPWPEGFFDERLGELI
jgi:predicted ATPase